MEGPKEIRCGEGPLRPCSVKPQGCPTSLEGGAGLLQKLLLGGPGPKRGWEGSQLFQFPPTKIQGQPSSPFRPPDACGCKRVMCEGSRGSPPLLGSGPASCFLPRPGSRLSSLPILRQQASLLPLFLEAHKVPPFPPIWVSQESPGSFLGPPSLMLETASCASGWPLVPSRGQSFPVLWGSLVVPLGIAGAGC